MSGPTIGEYYKQSPWGASLSTVNSQFFGLNYKTMLLCAIINLLISYFPVMP